MFNFPNNTKLFSKVILLIYILAYDSFSCTRSSSIPEIVRHFHFCQSKVENVISLAEHWLPTPGVGVTPTIQRIARTTTMPATSNRSANTSASWCQSYQGKHNTGKHWMAPHYIHLEKKQSKISSNSVYGPPWLAGAPISQWRAIGLSALLLCHRRRTLTLPGGVGNTESQEWA